MAALYFSIAGEPSYKSSIHLANWFKNLDPVGNDYLDVSKLPLFVVVMMSEMTK